MHTGRRLIMRAARLLAQGHPVRSELSMAKMPGTDALRHAVDTAMPLEGGLGHAEDRRREGRCRYARRARLVHGASAVHRLVVAQRFLGDGPATIAWAGGTP